LKATMSRTSRAMKAAKTFKASLTNRETSDFFVEFVEDDSSSREGICGS
jgi:hypothetical protein